MTIPTPTGPQPEDFDTWNEEKKRLHLTTPPPYFHPREVWWCALGLNIGSEEAGKKAGFTRPVVILRKFGAVFYAVPLSTTSRRGDFYFPFCYDGTTTSVALLTHVRALDSRRLIDKDGMISKEDFAALKRAIKALL